MTLHACRRPLTRGRAVAPLKKIFVTRRMPVGRHRRRKRAMQREPRMARGSTHTGIGYARAAQVTDMAGLRRAADMSSINEVFAEVLPHK